MVTEYNGKKQERRAQREKNRASPPSQEAKSCQVLPPSSLVVRWALYLAPPLPLTSLACPEYDAPSDPRLLLRLHLGGPPPPSSPAGRCGPLPCNRCRCLRHRRPAWARRRRRHRRAFPAQTGGWGGEGDSVGPCKRNIPPARAGRHRCHFQGGELVASSS